MLHPWNLSPDKAIALQKELRDRLVLKWDDRPVNSVAGVDVSIKTDTARAAIAVFRYPDLKPLASVTADVPLTFPYIPGLLSFRESPALLAAWEQLALKPDLVLVDGQGIAHPRGLGIASHLGLWIARPTIGVAKSRLYGQAVEPGPNKGDHTPLTDQHHPPQVIGAVLRTRPGTTPLYISPGHLIDLARSLQFVLACTTGYRLPEPTRWAHKVGAGEPLPVDEGQQPRLL
ncbi:MAG TPA: deoxyribonuclease V [Anaerolineae bacterium]|nr:deoxyribonuclease V [Anaerolineae bacterium]